VKRDFTARFTGSALGVFWAILQPLSLVVLYWFVFTYMFSRGPAGDNGYIFFLISGLLPWLGINEGVIRSTTTIVENAPMVRRLAFRSELLVVVPNASALIFEIVVAIGGSGVNVSAEAAPRLIWLLPFALLLQFTLQVGIGWFLAATFVVFRDLAPILGFLLSVVFYLSPILYPVAGRFEKFFVWNPMTPLLGLFRSAILSSALPGIGSSYFFSCCGCTIFRRADIFQARAADRRSDLNFQGDLTDEVQDTLSAIGASALFGQSPAPQTTTASDAAIEGGVPSYRTRDSRAAEASPRTRDPGTNPDPAKHFWRYGCSYHIENMIADGKLRGQEPGFVRPFGFVNIGREIYQRSDKYVWVWMPDAPAEAPTDVPTEPATRYNDEQVKYLESMRPEFTELTPKQSKKTIWFQESSSGLPSGGSWRNSLAVADMNGDGCPDIIAPPERKGGQMPAIFLGYCKGGWKFWDTVQWPRSIDDGSVVAADFNKDGHMDVAFGAHLSGVFVLLGDGKGNFTDSSEGLPNDFGTRRRMVGPRSTPPPTSWH
jgi:ABC-type polysaccharide/polyol phosphate export permease